MKHISEDNHIGKFVDKLYTHKGFILLKKLQVVERVFFSCINRWPNIPNFFTRNIITAYQHAQHICDLL